MEDFENKDGMEIAKVDSENRLVFGFFNVSKVGDNLVVDQQGESIESQELEKAAYDFVLNARIAGESHTRLGVGNLVESVVFTKEKQKAMVDSLKARGIEANMDLGADGWWGGFHIADDDVWKAVKDGKLTSFSIGGTATREE